MQQRELQAQLESEQQRYQVQEVISKVRARPGSGGDVNRSPAPRAGAAAAARALVGGALCVGLR